MSYVLDALRKSEQEREMAARVGVRLLYPVMIERTRRWPEPAALAVAGLIAVLVALGAWFLARHFPDGAAPTTPAAPAASQPASDQGELWPVPAPKAESRTAPPPPLVRETSMPPPPPLVRKTPAPPPPPMVRETPRSVTRKHATFANAAVPTPPPVIEKTALRVEPSASGIDLPALSIAGYVHDEQGGSLAMVNDRLVREGDEVAPGVRLEKILGDSAVFTYQGVRFRR